MRCTDLHKLHTEDEQFNTLSPLKTVYTQLDRNKVALTLTG